jgi:hypothetical protein
MFSNSFRLSPHCTLARERKIWLLIYIFYLPQLLIISLIIAAVLLTLGVLGPAIAGGIGFAALAVKGATLTAGFLGVSSGNVALAAIAGTAAFVAGSIIYGIGYGLILGLKECFNFIKSSIKFPADFSLLKSTDGECSRNHQVPLEYYPSTDDSAIVNPALLTNNRIPIVPAPGAQAYVDPHAASYHSPLVTAANATKSSLSDHGDLPPQLTTVIDTRSGSTRFTKQ